MPYKQINNYLPPTNFQAFIGLFNKYVSTRKFWNTYVIQNSALFSCFKYKKYIFYEKQVPYRDVTAGATGATAPKFLDTLTLSRPGGADSAHHRRGRT